MKKIIIFIILVYLICISVTFGFASNLNQEEGITPNHSAEYVRTLNRNASTSPDASFYNPAGLAFMGKAGLYVDFTNQVFYKKKMMTMDFKDLEIKGVTTYKGVPYSNRANFVTTMPKGDIDSDDLYAGDTMAPLLPDFNLVFSDSIEGRKYAAYLNLLITQAAPDFTYARGLPAMHWGNLAVAEVTAATLVGPLKSYTFEKAEAVRTEYFVGTTLGGAIEVLPDILSASLGVRYLDIRGRQKVFMKGVSIQTEDPLQQTTLDPLVEDWDIDTSYTGRGYGIISGVSFKFGNDFLVGLRYEYYAPLVAHKKTHSFKAPLFVELSGQLDMFKDGKPSPDGMVYMSSGGNGESTFHVTYPQSLSLGVSYNLFSFMRLEIGGDMYFISSTDWDGREKNYTRAYRVGGCVEFSITDGLVLSLGYSYYNSGIKPERRTDVDPALNSHSIAAGFGYVFNDRLSINVGGYYSFAVPVSITTVENVNLTDTMGIDTYHTIDREFNEIAWSIAAGVTYRIFGN